MESLNHRGTRQEMYREAYAVADAQAVAALVEVRQARRKAQNRINQRAYRARHSKSSTPTQRGHDNESYQVHRWRVAVRDGHKQPQLEASSAPHQSQTCSLDAIAKGELAPKCVKPARFDDGKTLLHRARTTSHREDIVPDPFADHLLSLIHYNVCRGLMLNKKVLSVRFFPCSEDKSILQPRPLAVGDARASLPKGDMPGCLAPSQMQLTCPHFLWIDALPFPRLRDNLIKHNDEFDHAGFLADLIGMLMGLTGDEAYLKRYEGMLLTRERYYGCEEEDGVEVEVGEEQRTGPDRRGLIIWGEPHLADSWEATPGFLNKWFWAVDGCDDLIDASNRWRRVRGEAPIKILPGVS